MPRKTNPGSISVGPGKTVPSPTTVRLLGTLPPDVGTVSGSGTGADGSTCPGLDAHINDPVGAHPATAISVSFQDFFFSSNVEGVLRELAGGAVTRPAELGVLGWLPNLGEFPVNWGTLKLGDGPVTNDVLMLNPNHPSTANDPTDVYPYWFTAVNPTPDWETYREYSYQAADSTILPRQDEGREPATDIWNVDTVVGGGPGVARAGGFTDGNGVPIWRSARLLPRAEDGMGNPVMFKTCVSGIVFPADRGVLALIHWPHNGNVAAFLAQSLTDRCVAALLMGTGLRDGTTTAPLGEIAYGDGSEGGIFSVGENADGEYDPFAYPGRASGQYNLQELHTGVSVVDGNPLKAPYNAGSQRTVNGIFPALGQVRLGTDAAAGVANVPPYGIPILGADANAYANPAAFVTVDGYPTVGRSLILSSNFFAYRLPVLDNYDARSGMKYTPRGMNPFDTKETSRYLIPQPFYDNTDTSRFETVGGTEYLKNGGNYLINIPDVEQYTNLPTDYWTWQVARFRHSFYVPASNSVGAKGTYWLLHFKKELDFEYFVRDGVMPWDATNGYDLYGAYPATSIEGDGNVVNENDSTAESPLGPAPDYGYASNSFWTGRQSLLISDADTHKTATLTTGTFSFQADPTGIMWCSGVAYFTPKTPVGVASFEIDDLDVVIPAIQNPWTDCYRTDDNPLTGVADPAVIDSPNPVAISLLPFSHGDVVGVPTYTVPATFTDVRGSRIGHVEFPFSYAGTHGGNPFSETNGPESTDALEIHLVAPDTITFGGDATSPAFVEGAAPRAFIRRPLGPTSGWEYAALPWGALMSQGHGSALSSGGTQILFHSTSFDTVGLTGSYGNFVNVASVPANRGYAPLFTATKDTTERFFDEMYRYINDWETAGTAAQRAQLNGPGMQGWITGPIAVPVRAGYTNTGTWSAASWTRNLKHTVSLGDASSLTELQVSGLPPRNPTVADWITDPLPSGLLRYPLKDYTVGTRPDLATEGVTQPSYAALSGTRSYIRAFDAAFSAGSDPVTAAGQPFVTLRFDGLTLRDFGYVPPGPGFPTSGLSIMLKVPGLTSWMDVGRPDGSGPSKQDPALDGAGCQVIGPYTFDSVDAESGFVYCQVRVNVGPTANLALGDGNEVPVLVKVTMQDVANAKLYDMLNEATLPSFAYGWTGDSGVAAPSARVRGIVGIRIVHPDDVIENPGVDPVPPGPPGP